MMAQKSLDRKSGAKDNTGNIYAGVSDTAGSQPLVLAPGDDITWSAVVGKKRNLQNIWIDADTAGSRLTVVQRD